jgi:hypothetical protein
MKSKATDIRNWLAVALLGGLVVGGCGLTKRPAVGRDRRINVIADEADWYRSGVAVRGVLNRRITIFFEEQIFNANWVRPEKFDDHRNRKNLFIVASLRDTSYKLGDKKGAELLKSIMSPARFDSLARAGAEMIYLRDFWAAGQLVVIAAATEGELLAKLLQENMEAVYQFFDEGLDERVRGHLFRKGKLRLDNLRRRFGWVIDIPSNYKLVTEDPAGHFYRFMRHYPDRSIFVYWETRPRTEMADSALVHLRERLAGSYYDGEEINRERTTVQSTEFAGFTGKMINGNWENNELILGGDFFSYCINTDDRFYMVDAKLFASGMDKEPWLRQLRIVTSTFKVGR